MSENPLPPELRGLSALAVRQPWASSIVLGGKDIENRTWSTRVRGPVLIHASKGVHPNEVNAWCNHIEYRHIQQTWGLRYSSYKDMPNGGIIGVADIVDCVSTAVSQWFVGPWGFVLRNAYPLQFIPCRGMLGFFKPVFAEVAP